MNIHSLPQPDPSWPESAQQAIQQFITLSTLQSEQITLQSEQITLQSEQIEKQAARIAVLEERLRQNSRNSDRPSSSDHKAPPKKRKKSPRAKGGQKGRKGAHRELLEATEVIKMPIDHSCPCGGSWAPLDEPERFQVTELPEVKPRVIEYQVQRHRCTCCGSVAHPGYQPVLGYTRFGPRLHAYVTELSVTYRLSIRQIKSHLERGFGLKLSSGAISGVLTRSAIAVKASLSELHEWFKLDDGVKNVDETGWKIAGKRAYMIGAINAYAALFHITMRRGTAEIERLIGEDKDRLILSDRAKAYEPWAHRQLCWSHVIRALTFISEARGGKTHGQPLVILGEQLFRLNRQWRRAEVNLSEYLVQSGQIKTRMKRHLTALSQQSRLSPIAAGKVRHLLKFYDQLWTFRDHPELPIHNNDQERELRNPVIKRKLSLGNDTISGAKRYAQLLSVIRSLARQGRSWRDWFVQLCQGQPESLVPQMA
jgi:transposase